jgi:CRISPR-associated protein Csd1
MSWIQMLHKTYDLCSVRAWPDGEPALTPLFHVVQNAHIEIVINGTGDFRYASVIERVPTIIPATEVSATSRTSKVRPHALCDHIKYCALDYPAPDAQNDHASAYLAQLQMWCDSPHAHPKAQAVLQYVKQGTVLRDLIVQKVVPVKEGGSLLDRWESTQQRPPLLKQLQKDVDGSYKPQNALIRWVVESDVAAATWTDPSLQNAWIAYCSSLESVPGRCMVTGQKAGLARKHPRGIRDGKDGAKLISYKESEWDFTFRGRFAQASEAASVSTEATQKAHSALAWLIRRQAFVRERKSGPLTAPGQAIVAWCVGGKSVPDPCAGGLEGFESIAPFEDDGSVSGDFGQAYALRLKKALLGYRQDLSDTDEIVVMGVDSATPGRLAISFYRELKGSEFLDRIQNWHERCAWPQDYGYASKRNQRIRFVGAPSPIEIARVAVGRGANTESGKKLVKAIVERLIPCVVDGLTSSPIPRDIVISAVRQAGNRLGFKGETERQKKDAWEKCLGIACALYRGSHQQEEYKMALEEERTSRDYLYGRLLAIAEYIEDKALRTADEKRDTNAAKLMQRFSERPAETWLTLWRALPPYEARLKAKNSGTLAYLKGLLDEVTCKFDPSEFTANRPLTGEFLLGYHCQRRKLNEWTGKKHPTAAAEATKIPTTDENFNSNLGE